MNVFKYIWLKLKDYFNSREYLHETYEEYQDRKDLEKAEAACKSESKFQQDPSPKIIKEWREDRFKELSEKFPLDLPPKEKDHVRWEINEESDDLHKYPVTTQNDLEKSDMLQELLTLKHTADKLRDDKNKPKRPYNRATKQQVARIKVLVGRGKTTKQIAKDVGLPYDNVNYYVKKFGG